MKYIKTFEELETTGTYLSSHYEDKLKEYILSICKETNIDLPIELGSKEFLKVKKQIINDLSFLKNEDFIKELNLIWIYTIKEGDTIEKITKETIRSRTRNPHYAFDGRNRHLSIKDLERILKNFNKKSFSELKEGETIVLNIDRLLLSVEKIVQDKIKPKMGKKNFPFDTKNIKFGFKLSKKEEHQDIYQVVLPEELKNWIVKNNDVNSLDHLIYVSSESDNFNRIHFGGRSDRAKIFGPIDKSAPMRISTSHGTEYLGIHGKSYINLLHGIPKSLRGTGLGYSIYKQFIQYLGYASSSAGSSTAAQSVWKKICNDPDLCGLIIQTKSTEKNGHETINWGNILMFDKKYKGDFKKISEEFIKKFSTTPPISNTDEYEVELGKIIIDDFLKEKGVEPSKG